MSKEINLEKMFRRFIDPNRDAVKSAFIINGAAAFALLAFLAHLVAEGHGSVSDFAVSLLLFGIGALFAVMSFAYMYMSYTYSLFACTDPIRENEEEIERIGKRLSRTFTRAGLLLFGSHTFYILGLLWSVRTFFSLNQ